MFIISIALLLFWFYDLYAKYNGHTRFSKPLLLPSVIFLYLYFSYTLHKPIFLLEIVALLFGWAGDVLLLSKKDGFLFAGLVSFLAGHVAYILLFFSFCSLGFSPTLFCAIVLYAIYGWILYKRIAVHVPKQFKAPVIIYLFVILSMSCTAGLLYHSISFLSWLMIWGGSLLFVASDTLVAIEKFCNPNIRGVMELYVPAQVLLMIGVLLL